MDDWMVGASRTLLRARAPELRGLVRPGSVAEVPGSPATLVQEVRGLFGGPPTGPGPLLMTWLSGDVAAPDGSAVHRRLFELDCGMSGTDRLLVLWGPEPAGVDVGARLHRGGFVTVGSWAEGDLSLALARPYC